MYFALLLKVGAVCIVKFYHTCVFVEHASALSACKLVESLAKLLGPDHLVELKIYVLGCSSKLLSLL